jgi:hypothetical protein
MSDSGRKLAPSDDLHAHSLASVPVCLIDRHGTPGLIDIWAGQLWGAGMPRARPTPGSRSGMIWDDRPFSILQIHVSRFTSFHADTVSARNRAAALGASSRQMKTRAPLCRRVLPTVEPLIAIALCPCS